MKTHPLLAGIILFFLISGCSKEVETLKYSCNEDINYWVESNLSDIRKMKREDIIHYPKEYQKAILNALTPESKLDIWEEKLNDVISLNWDEDERSHLIKFKMNMNLQWFGNNWYYLSQRDSFIKQWISYGLGELGWSKSLLHSMLLKIETNKSDNGYLLETVNNSYKVDPYNGDCECSISDDWCDVPGSGSDLGYCGNDNCRASTLGCGTLWLYPCDGNCKLGIQPDDN